MTAPRLVLVLDPDRVPAGAHLPDLAARAASGGVDAVIVRARGESASSLPDLAAAIGDRIAGRAALIVNGDPELAIRLGAGIHLPERADGLQALRERLGPDAPIGRSVHSPASAAGSAGADYVIAGHVFPSRSHPGQTPLGLRVFAAIAAAAPCPVLAVGGITPERVRDAVHAGAAGVAVIDAITTAPDPEAAARDLSLALSAAGMPERPLSRRTSMTTDTAIIQITVNGKPFAVPAGATIRDFLAGRKLADSMAIVERNGIIVPRPAYPETALETGDVLEIVHAVGGG